MPSPVQSLNSGQWVKLICGASFQDISIVRNLALAFTLAGVDCIDVAADPAVVAVVNEGIDKALTLTAKAKAIGYGARFRPWTMVSLNVGEDPHFRKASFDPSLCPHDCPRPCESVCPVKAIAFSPPHFSGVIEARCYGCGRCLPVCPPALISTQSHVASPEVIRPLIVSGMVNAIEIHTQVGQEAAFAKLWDKISPWNESLQLLAISCPDHRDVIDYLKTLHRIMSPLSCILLWQADGRPMSGDIGKGTTHAAIKLAQKFLNAGLPGYIQLAGGTNHYTATKLRSLGLLQKRGARSPIAGIAYGSYARSRLLPILDKLDKIYQSFSYQDEISLKLEDYEKLLWPAVSLAHSLVSQSKSWPGIKSDHPEQTAHLNL